MKRKIFSLALASTMILGSFGSVMADEAKELEVMTNKPFVDGYPGGTFKPDKDVTRAEVTKLVAVAYDRAKQKSNFPDTKDHWATEYIGALSAELKGFPDGNYKPDDSMTRAQFASVMSRINKSEIEITNKSFSDIGNHWAEKDIQRMASAGVVQGYEDGSFKPEQNVTRAEAVAMILRNLGINPDPDIAKKVANVFTDVRPGAWYIEEVLTAAGIYKYTQDENGNRIVVANTDVKDLDKLKVVNKVITDSSEDLLVQISRSDDDMPLDYAAFYAEGYHIGVRDKWIVEDSKGNDASEILTGKSVSYNTPYGSSFEEVPVLDKDEMKYGEKYTVTFPIGYQGNYYTTAVGTVQKVKETNSKVTSLDSIKLTKPVCDNATGNLYAGDSIEIKSGKLVGGFLDGDIDEIVELEKVNATVNGGTMNLLDTQIAGDVEVTSSNSDVVEVIEDFVENPDFPDDEDKQIRTGISLAARFAGKATITIKYGDLVLEKEIEVVKAPRVVGKIESNLKNISIVKDQAREVVLSVYDQYGDPIHPECGQGDIQDYIHANIEGDAVIEVLGTKPINGNKFEVTVKGKAAGNGNVYVNVLDEDFKGETNIFSIPVNVTERNTLGEKKVIIEDTAETAKMSKDAELDLSEPKDKELIFNISQFTKEGAFAGKVKNLKFEVDNPGVIEVVDHTDDNFKVTAKKVGEAIITLRDNDDNVVAKVKINVIDSSRFTEIIEVNYRVDAKSDHDGVALNELREYTLSDFVTADRIVTGVTSLWDPVISTVYDDDGTVREGVLRVYNKDIEKMSEIGNIKVELTMLNDDGTVAVPKTVILPNSFDEKIVELADKDGSRRAKVSIEISSENGDEFDKVYDLNALK